MTRLLRMKGVQDRIDGSKAWIYELDSRGVFPVPVKIGRSSFWIEEEVEAWIKERVAPRAATSDDGSGVRA